MNLIFYNVTPAESVDIRGEGFTLAADTIVRNPSGEAVARYADGQWCVGDRRFHRIECGDPVVVVVRFGRDEKSGGRHGPYRRMRLIDGVLLGDQAPIAALDPAQGWVAEPNAQLWRCVCLQPARQREQG